MRRARTTDRPLSSVLLLLIALLIAQLCVHGHTGLHDQSGTAALGGPGTGVVLPASVEEQASVGREALAPTAGEPDEESAASSDAAGGACPERQAPEQSSSPHLAIAAAAESPSLSEATAPQTARWPEHTEASSAKSPPPHVCVLRI